MPRRHSCKAAARGIDVVHIVTLSFGVVKAPVMRLDLRRHGRIPKGSEVGVSPAARTTPLAAKEGASSAQCEALILLPFPPRAHVQWPLQISAICKPAHTWEDCGSRGFKFERSGGRGDFHDQTIRNSKLAEGLFGVCAE